MIISIPENKNDQKEAAKQQTETTKGQKESKDKTVYGSCKVRKIEIIAKCQEKKQKLGMLGQNRVDSWIKYKSADRKAQKNSGRDKNEPLT